MSTVAELEVVVGADTSDLERGLQQGNSQIGTFARSAGRNMIRFGAVATGAMIGLGAAAVNSAIDWEDSWADVKKTVEASDTELAALEDTLRTMATSPVFGALDNAHDSLAGIAATAGQLGVETSAIDEFTESIAALTVASDLSADDAAMFAAKFANVTGMDIATDIDNLADTIVTLGNNLSTTETEITAFGNRLAGLSTAGFGPAQILAWGAAMASVGITAELGSTNFTKFVDDMQAAARNGGDDLATFATTAGLTADEFAELALNDPSAAMDAFIGGLSSLDAQEVPQVLDDLNVTGTEQRSVLTKLAAGHDTVTESLNLANEAWGGNGAAMAEAQAKANTTKGAMNRLKNSMNEIGIEVGERFLPAIADIATGFSELLTGEEENGLNSLAQGFGSLVGNIVALGAGFADLIDNNIFGDAVDFSPEGMLTGIAAWGELPGLFTTTFDAVGLAINQVLFNITDGVDDFFRDLQITFLTGLSEIMNVIPEQVADTIPGLDIAIASIDLSLSEVQKIEGLDQLADQWATSIAEITNSGQNIDFGLSGVQSQLINPDFVAELDPITLDTIKDNLSTQLQEAIATGDDAAIELLTPIAQTLQLDLEDIWLQAQEGTREAIEGQTIESTATVDITLIPGEIDGTAVVAAINTSVSGGSQYSTGGVDGVFHEGGIFSASQGREGLALLEDGEGIFTRSQMRALGLMAGAGGRDNNGNTFNVYSYGKNPNELARMVQRSIKDQGYRG